MTANSQSGTLGALNAEVRLPLAAFGGVAFQVQGTFSGTITFEASIQGQDFTAFRVVPANSSTATSTTTTTGLWAGSAVGYTVVRARMSSYSSGQAIVFIQADLASPGGGGGGGGVGSDVNLIEVGGASIALGQAAMAASVPVVIASNQTAIPVTGSISATNPSVGPTGSAAPAEATEVGFVDASSGELRAVTTENLDYDTGAGSAPVTILGIALPASGGPVAGGTATNPIQVGDAGGSITVDGSVTANAGTNLNTSALALESGGNLAAIAASASVLDDWDESDRAKVNPIVGQAGVAAGAGAVGATVQRVVLATDTTVPNVTGSVADGVAASGNPVVVGAIAKSPDGTDPGSVAEDQTARFTTDLNRRQYVNTHHASSTPVHLNGSSAYTDQAFFPDPGDGFAVVMTSFQCSSGAATAINFFLEEGSTIVYGPIYLEAVAGRGFCSGPINRRFTASTAVTLTSSAAIAQSIDAEYYIEKV